MKLKAWLKKEKITYKEFARLGGWHIQTVSFWCNETPGQIPALKNAKKIEALTNGEVTASEIRTP